jgi:hypothetical protein
VQNIDGSKSQIIQADVARSDGAVAVCDADNRLFEIGIAETDGSEHRPIGCSLDAVSDDLASLICIHADFAFDCSGSLASAAAANVSVFWDGRIEKTEVCGENGERWALGSRL